MTRWQCNISSSNISSSSNNNNSNNNNRRAFLNKVIQTSTHITHIQMNTSMKEINSFWPTTSLMPTAGPCRDWNLTILHMETSVVCQIHTMAGTWWRSPKLPPNRMVKCHL